MNLDRDDALRIRVGERIQQNVLDRAEDGGRRPYTERQGQRRDGGEARGFAKRSCAIAQILPTRFYKGFPAATTGAHLFFNLLDTAKFDERLPASFWM